MAAIQLVLVLVEVVYVALSVLVSQYLDTVVDHLVVFSVNSHQMLDYDTLRTLNRPF